MPQLRKQSPGSDEISSLFKNRRRPFAESGVTSNRARRGGVVPYYEACMARPGIRFLEAVIRSFGFYKTLSSGCCVESWVLSLSTLKVESCRWSECFAWRRCGAPKIWWTGSDGTANGGRIGEWHVVSLREVQHGVWL